MDGPDRRVGERYAVLFREQDGRPVAGSLELGPQRLLLTGTVDGRRQELALRLAEIVEIRIGRLAADRLNGCRTLVLEREQGRSVQVAPLETGLLRELAELLAVLTGERSAAGEQLAVAVPLKTGCVARARELLELGPPLDPGLLGLTGHRVYVRDDEALFVFTGADVRARVGEAMRSPALWRAGLAWRDCITGRPQIVDGDHLPPAETRPDYAWTSTHAAGAGAGT